MELALCWQDWLFMVGNATLNTALLVGVFKQTTRVPLLTSIGASVGLVLSTIAVLALGLLATGIALGISSMLWLGIFLTHPDINQSLKKLS